MARVDAANQVVHKSTDPKSDGKRLSVKIFSPYQVYYQGEVTSISAVNKTGPFDVLYAHANFFSLLLAGNVVVQAGLTKLSIPISRGIIKVTNNNVTVFVDV